MKYYIGLDWGERKIGVAFGDDETRQAFGFGVIEQGPEMMEALRVLAQEYDTDTVVIGLSEDRVHRDNRQAIKKFAQSITDATGLTVLFAPELFSTKQAQSNLKVAGKKKIMQNDDVESARIILQSFLDHV